MRHRVIEETFYIYETVNVLTTLLTHYVSHVSLLTNCNTKVTTKIIYKHILGSCKIRHKEQNIGVFKDGSE